MIYEGRGDGKRGAHFSCMNSGTMGVCVIGNFQDAEPTDEALEALRQLAAWESCDKDIEIDGTKYHNSSAQSMYILSGHRDANTSANACTNTVCPGTHLYSKLPDLRSDISQFECLSAVTSVESLMQEYQLRVGPNPNHGRLSITLRNNPNKDYIAFYFQNLLGQTDLVHKVNSPNGKVNTTIDISHYPSGVYILTVKNGKVEIPVKIIKS